MAAAFALDLGTQNSTLCEIVRSGVDVILNEVRRGPPLRPARHVARSRRV